MLYNNKSTMTTKNNTTTKNNAITNEQLLQKLEKLEHEKLEKLEIGQIQLGNGQARLGHGQTIIYWLLGASLAFLWFVAGLVFFTWGDAKKLQADVHILQQQHSVQHP